MLFFVLYLVLFCLVPFVHLRCAGLKCVSCTELSPQYGDAVQGRVLGRPSCYPLKGLLPFLSCLLCFVFVVYKPAQYSLLLTYFIEGVAGAGACPLVLVPGLPPLRGMGRSVFYCGWPVLTCTGQSYMPVLIECLFVRGSRCPGPPRLPWPHVFVRPRPRPLAPVSFYIPTEPPRGGDTPI